MKNFLRATCGAAIVLAIFLQGMPVRAQQPGAAADTQQTRVPVPVQPPNGAAPIVQPQTVPCSSDVRCRA